MDHEGRSVALSMIFKWYADDFGPPDMVCHFPCHLRSLPGYKGMQRDTVLWQTVDLAASAVPPLDEVLCSCFVACTLSQCAASGRPCADTVSFRPMQLLPWLLRFLPDGPAHELEDLLAHLGPDNVKISYKPYDWSLNNSGEAPEEEN